MTDYGNNWQGVGRLHMEGCTSLFHTDPCTTTPDTVQIGDFSPVKMNTDQIDVARYLEIRYRSLAREIIDLLPPAAHRDQALRELLSSKMMLVHAISRTPEAKL